MNYHEINVTHVLDTPGPKYHVPERELLSERMNGVQLIEDQL